MEYDKRYLVISAVDNEITHTFNTTDDAGARMMLAVHKEKGDLPESGWLREESTQREVTSWITPDDV